jgi:hypothetical protein
MKTTQSAIRKELFRARIEDFILDHGEQPDWVCLRSAFSMASQQARDYVKYRLWRFL